MTEQTTKEKLRTIAEWLFTNKDALRKEELSVQYAVLSPTDDGNAKTFGVYAINETNMWRVMYDVIYEFYKDNEDYESFDEYMDELKDQFLEWFDEENECETISYIEHEGMDDLKDQLSDWFEDEDEE